MQRIQIASLLVLLTACGSSSGSTDVDAAPPGIDADTTPIGLTTCSATGTRFEYVHSANLLGDSATTASVWRDGVEGHIVGVKADSDGSSFRTWFYRFGDPDAATFEAVGRHDVADPLFHIQYTSCADSVSEQDCLGGTSPLGGVYYGAFAGTIAVDEITPVLAIRFTLRSLQQGRIGQGGDGIPGTIDGCIAVPN